MPRKKTNPDPNVRKSSTIKIDNLRWRLFGARMRMMDMGLSEGIEMLIDAFLAGRLQAPDQEESAAAPKPAPTSFQEDNARCHELVEKILESNSPVTIKALLANLDHFAHSAEYVGKKTAKQLNDDIDIANPGLSPRKRKWEEDEEIE